MGVKVKYIATALGSKLIDNEYYINHFDEKGKDIRNFLKAVGRDVHCIAKKHENSLTLASKAVDKLLKESNLKGNEIDLIIFASQLPEYTVPTQSCLIHKHIKGKLEATIFDINANCLGTLNALDIGNRYLQGKDWYKKALIIGSDLFSAHCKEDCEHTYPLFTDGACAILIEKTEESDESGMIGTSHRTNSFQAGTVVFPECGLSSIDSYSGSSTKVSWSNPDIEEVPDLVSEALNDILNRHGYTIDNIDWVCGTQLSLSLLNDGVKACGIDEEKIIYIGDKYGYTGTSAPFIALHDGIKENKIKPGDIVMLWTMGIGYSIGVSLFKY